MAQKKRCLEFWFEFASPYSFLAAPRLATVAAAKGLAPSLLRWRPFLLGPVLKARGISTTPNTDHVAKGAYMWRDLERRAAKHGFHAQRPSRFPRHPLLTARIATQDAPWMPEFAVRVFEANFAEDRDIADPDVIATILTAMGLDPHPVLEKAATPEIKLELKRHTEEALALGIFGAPTFVVRRGEASATHPVADDVEELFWGDDRLEDAIDWVVAVNAAAAGTTAS